MNQTQCALHISSTASPLQPVSALSLIQQCGHAVAYVKFPTASEAAKTQEQLHMTTIKDGRASVALKIFIADEPERHPWDVSRCAALMPGTKLQSHSL